MQGTRKSSLSRGLQAKTSPRFKSVRQGTVKTNQTRKSILRRAAVAAGEATVIRTTRSRNIHEEGCLLSILAENAAGIDPADKAMTFHCDEDVLSWCVAMLEESPVAAALIDDAASAGWAFSLDDLNNGGFYLDVENRLCRLDHHSMSQMAFARSAHFRNAVLLSFVRALRDIWHETRIGSFEDKFRPGDTLILERLRAADGDTVAVFAGWELRCAGHADIWRYVIGSDDGDLAMVFSRYLDSEPSALFDGSVLIHAFRQWFADEQRVNICDHDTLENLDGILQESGRRDPFGKGSLTGKIAESLSRLPGGKAYLQGFGDSLICDPFYAGFRDPVNKTHLSHLMYDLEVVMAGNVPFRDEKLARLIFPESETVGAE